MFYVYHKLTGNSRLNRRPPCVGKSVSGLRPLLHPVRARPADSLERVLHEQAGDDAHGGGQRGGAHAVALQRLLVDARGDDQRRRAGETGQLAGNHQLNVT